MTKTAVTPVPKEDISSIQVFINKEITRFEKEVIKEKDLKKMVTQYKDLKVDGIEDRPGLAEVRKARIALKKTRVDIAAKGKSLRESANQFNKAIIARENELVAIISPTEQVLADEEDRIADLKEQKRIEEERAEANRIQERMERLREVNFEIDFYKLKGLTDEAFESILFDATEEFERIKVAQAEEKKRQEEEQAMLKHNQKVMEEGRKKEADRIARVAKEQARIWEEQEAKEKAMAAEQKKLADEKEKLELDRKEFEMAKQRALKKKKEVKPEVNTVDSEKEGFQFVADEIDSLVKNPVWERFISKEAADLADVLLSNLLAILKTARSNVNPH